jgi:hypothetical protein
MTKVYSLSQEHWAVMTSHVYGMVFEYFRHMGPEVNVLNVDHYVRDTSEKLHAYLLGNTSMGADFSDFQCVAVPKLARLAKFIVDNNYDPGL